MRPVVAAVGHKPFLSLLLRKILNSVMSYGKVSFRKAQPCSCSPVYTYFKKGCLLNYCIVHCALLHTQTATHHGCNEFVHCCMPRPQSIVVQIASIANTRMSLSHSRHLQCYLKIRYIQDALRSGYATMRSAQCNNSEDNFFLIR